LFIDAGVNVNKESTRPVSKWVSYSSPPEPVIKTSVIHSLERYNIATVRELLKKANVDQRKTEVGQHELGQNSSWTAFYILCATNRSVIGDRARLQIASALLEFGADPNSLNSYVYQIVNPEFK